MTALILAQVVVTRGMLSALRYPEARMRRTFLETLISFVQSAKTSCAHELDEAQAIRAADLNLSPTERRCLPAARRLVGSLAG